mmetsp:Transcript_24114/g.57154  ORF Transcript_24114/g.57154 Transcript_24114/m.57154 type:complete len:823 (+) Transcript_24114:224-2692(+)
MANSLQELKSRYDDFLRHENFEYADRIGTAVDDYKQRSSRMAGGGGGGNGNGAAAGGGSDKGGASAVGIGHPRLRVPLSDLRSFAPRLSNQLVRDPLRHIRALEASAHDVALEERPGYDKSNVRVRVALGGPVSGSPVGPRELGSSSLRRLVCVEGVAVKVSGVKPKVVQSVHYCPATRQHERRQYVDATDPELGLPVVDESGRELPDKVVQLTSASYPTQDKDGNVLETEFGLSVYKDHQTVTLQEMPERAPMGQLPRSVELVLDHDLVDRVKPGDRVQVVGVYRALSSASQGQRTTSGLFPTVVLANDIRILGRDSNGLVFTPNDVRTIRDLAKRSDILDVLGRSVCPSIHGHGVIKKALALQLLGGCEKNLANGTHLRGDINVLMVGDPSTAKSQLLRSAMGIAPLAVSTTGKGSSGVGLTAAVTSDPETRERRLEAGAMVLADRGLVCVDEFDKMGESDRVAIHEAMEQQTVTIAKAGMHASLNARCSVLAAANPVYGQYDRRKRVQDNIGLPDSLLSRFDLLFVVLDQIDPEGDRRIAAHVIRGHRYQGTAPGRKEAADSEDDEESSDDEDENEAGVSIWAPSRYDETANPNKDDDDPHSDDVLQHEFLRKYLHYAKTRIRPTLTEEAREAIAGRYAEMRGRQDDRTLPITARSLETIIRLASAHAKARLSPTVEAEPDVAAAMDILSFALYHENNKVLHEGDEQKADDEGTAALGKRDEPDLTDGSDGGDIPGKRRRTDGAGEDDAPEAEDPASEMSADDLKQAIYLQVSRDLADSVPLGSVMADNPDRAAVLRAVQSLEDDGRVMVSEDEVYVVD